MLSGSLWWEYVYGDFHCLLGASGVSPLIGPRLFVLYIAELADEIHQHDVKFHAYADDSQIMHCHRDDIATSAAHLSQCVVDIGHWMAANRLQMNPAKTELLWAGTLLPR